MNNSSGGGERRGMGGFDGGLYQLAFLLVIQGVLVSWSSQDFVVGFLI